MKSEIFLSELQKLGSPERAIADKRYHKSERMHWGVPAKESADLIRSFCKEANQEDLLLFATQLWETNLFNPMICAAKILALPRVKPSRKLWNTILQFLKDVDGWALEDTLAHAAWKCILADETLLDQVEKWTKHSNFWMRRAALVYTLPFAKSGKDPERMLKWASCYADDSEWFIQKAIGWWLRDLSEHNPRRVILFVEEHKHLLKGVAKKEATRKLDAVFLATLV